MHALFEAFGLTCNIVAVKACGTCITDKTAESFLKALKAEITNLIKQRDALIEKLARDFASALYAEGIAVKLSGYGKRDLRRIAHFMSEDIDRYIEPITELLAKRLS